MSENLKELNFCDSCKNWITDKEFYFMGHCKFNIDSYVACNKYISIYKGTCLENIKK